MTADASNPGLGTMLLQGPTGNDLLVAYANHSLNNAESHYTTSEKELLAIVWATKYFRPYLYGQKFKIVNDHKPLVWIMNVKDPGSRLMRWRIKLAKYDYEILHKSGIQNTNTDALSSTGSVGALEEQKEISNDKVRGQILYEFHDSLVAGHRGMNKTYRTIRWQYTWPKMRRKVID